jgi:two-component system, NtrC family, C4-dicarboxylate transport response regulator DctD
VTGDTRPEDVPRVVVVDDDPRVLRATKLFLESRGAIVRAVGEPLDAALAVTEHRPTVLVLDVSMPSLNGERLWGLFRGVTVKMPGVVFYSGVGEGQLAAVGRRDPTVQRVLKSASPEELWAAVLRAHETSLTRQD